MELEGIEEACDSDQEARGINGVRSMSGVEKVYLSGTVEELSRGVVTLREKDPNAPRADFRVVREGIGRI